MKGFLLLLSFFFFTVSTHAQTLNTPVPVTGETTVQTAPPDESDGPGLNLIREYTPRQAFTDHVAVTVAPGEEVMLSTSYLDGLGRPLQTVQRMAGPGKEDLIQHAVYDGFGRSSTQLLPYADLPEDLRPGAFRHDAMSKQFGFYQEEHDAIANTYFPYAKQILENDPRSRPLKAGAPGEAWQPENGHAVEMAYRFNAAGEVAIWRYNFTTGLPEKGADYPASRLRVVQTTDENKHAVEEFTDLYGRVILKKVQAPDENSVSVWATTRYIYDDKGLLRAVFPPELCRELDEQNQALIEPLLDKWAFRYRYDTRGRMTAKRIPGKEGWDLIVYNHRDLPVLTQDPVQRNNNQWSFTKYDHLNRPIMTGTVVLTDDEAFIRLRSGKVLGSETGYERDYPSNPFGYTRAGSWPLVYEDDIETVTWYDDYDYPCGEEVKKVSENVNEAYAMVDGNEADLKPNHPHPFGQVTGTAIHHPYLDGVENFLYAATYYDTKLRPVASASENALGGIDCRYMAYSWAGEVLAQVEQHIGNESVLQKRVFTYDHTGRLLQTDHTVEKDGGYHPVRWTEGQNVTILENLIYKNTSSTSFDAGAFSVQRIPEGRDGSVFFNSDGVSSMRRVFGLDDGGFSFTPLTARHAIYLSYNDIHIIDNGSLYYNQETWGGDDELKIVRENGQVVYKKNDVVFFTSASPATGELRAVCSFKLKDYFLQDLQIAIEKPAGEVQTVALAKNAYNALGELVNKKLHSTDEGQSWLQDTDYRYNIRGWLERINDPANVSLTDQGKAFGMQLSYHEGFSQAQYNGNISGMCWTVMGQDEQAYGYTYDAMNRLADAYYQEKGSSGSWDQQLDLYNVSLGYDRNGNIQTLDRNGYRVENVTASNSIDELVYSYDGNRLTKVKDNSTSDEGFKDGADLSTESEYEYDANGNMITDANKGISGITYNKLNLPVRIYFDDGRYIKNHYTLDGIKRRSEYYLSTSAPEPEKVTDYVGSVQYENGLLTRITTEEGRVAPDEQDPDTWRYYYNLTDHLGNVRVTVTDPTATEYMATLEDVNQEEEEAEFGDSYKPQTIQTNVADNSPDNKAQLLRGYAATDEVMGLTKSLAVYPGDKVDMQVYANFTAVNTNNPADAVNFGLMFLQAFGIPTTGEGSMNPADFDGFSQATAPTNSTYPINAYLNYIYFDKHFDLIDMGFFRVPGSAQNNPTLIQHTLDITEEGFLMVYVANEQTELTDVYFDNYKVTHTPTIVAQTDSYYPFGLSHGNMSYVREGRAKNQFLYNGKELVEGFELGWYDYGARYYAPDLGRFAVTDRFSDKYISLSPYQYAANNPALIVDINGDSLWISHKDQKFLYDNGILFLDGKEFSGKQKGFLKKAVRALNQIMQTEEGSSMINQLQSSDNNFNLLSSNQNPNGNQNEFKAENQIKSHANQIRTDPEAANTIKALTDNNIDISGGSGGDIFWDPNGNSVPVVDGKFNTNATADLSHELSHAVDSDLGMSDDRPHLHNKVTRSEWNAVYRENRVRQGLNLPLRTHYIKQTNSRGVPLKGVGPRMLTPANQPLKPSWLK